MPGPQPPQPVRVIKPDYAPAPRRGRDDLAYLAPMFVFLILTWLGTNATFKQYVPHAYVVSYAAKTLVVAVLLVLLWRHYTKIRWNHWWLGVVVGIVGIFQWIGMQLWLQRRFDVFDPSGEAFDPTKAFSSQAALYAFYAVRLAGAVLVVPVMEELFWRDFLWRQILAPNDFKLAQVGEWSWTPFLGVSIAFAVVHGNWWLTSIVWALMIAALLVYTKSLGACIIAHATTNLLLGGYVLWTRDWAFW
jgi:uncharacterized protein